VQCHTAASFGGRFAQYTTIRLCFQACGAEAGKIFFKSGSVYRTSLSKTAGLQSRIMEIVPFL
jgi:hypothetical protein